MKILVATGSFKDVFSPVEAMEMICGALDREKNEICGVPFCDGGEYTYEVLRQCFPYREVTVENVINPYGCPITAGYLTDGETAHIVSSRILRLFPEEDDRKNPLFLTDYGFGQLIADALQKGCKNITLYLGGTSTACCGMGTIQALGAELLTQGGVSLTHYCQGADLAFVSGIKHPVPTFADVQVHVVADGNSKVDALPGITGLKIGKRFSEQKEEIIGKAMAGVHNILRITGISPEKDFTGAAGGLLFGLEQVFPNIRYTLGGRFFNQMLGIEAKIAESDLVITGEGRYDNTADGKAPSVIAELAKKYRKPAVLVCGQIDKSAVADYSGGVINCEDKPQFSKQGIVQVLTCQEYYDAITLPDTYEDSIRCFREKTPQLLRQLFEKIGL